MSLIDYAILKQKAKISREYEWVLNQYESLLVEIRNAKTNKENISAKLNEMALNTSNKELFSVLFKNGVSPKVKDNSGNSIIMNYLNHRSTDSLKNPLKIVKYLVGQGCDIHATNNNNETVLFVSNSKTAGYFLEKGLDPNHINSSGENVLMQMVNTADILFFIKKGAKANIVNNRGENLLFKHPQMLTILDRETLLSIHNAAPKTNDGINFLFPIFSSFSKNFMNTTYDGRAPDAYEQDQLKFQTQIKKVEEYKIPVDYHAIDSEGNNLFRYCNTKEAFDVLVSKNVDILHVNKAGETVWDILKEKEFYNESKETTNQIQLVILSKEKEMLEKDTNIVSPKIHLSKRI